MSDTWEAAFWAKTNRSGECWVWTGRRNPKGYGLAWNRARLTGNRRADEGAHRIAWVLINGPIPAGLCVLHRCDNPPCIRPDHLWLGTKADNSADMKAKGRTYRPTWIGAAVPTAKITDVIASEIRRKYATGSVTQAELARQYGLTPPTVSAVITRRTWRHVA